MQHLGMFPPHDFIENMGNIVNFGIAKWNMKQNKHANKCFRTNKPGLSLKLKDQVGILAMERNSIVEGKSLN